MFYRFSHFKKDTAVLNMSKRCLDHCRFQFDCNMNNKNKKNSEERAIRVQLPSAVYSIRAYKMFAALVITNDTSWACFT